MTFVRQRLARAIDALDDALSDVPHSDRATALSELLEAMASALSGIDLQFLRAFSSEARWFTLRETRRLATPVAEALRNSSAFHPAVALAALGEIIAEPGRRAAGAYYTDPRLARFAASGAAAGETLLDPACGSGSLLVASALVACGTSAEALRAYVGTCINGWDNSPNAIRCARASLAVLAPDRDTLRAVDTRLRCIDALLVPREDTRATFSRVIVNPPWEKLKLNRHEFNADRGAGSHYGDDILIDSRANAMLRRHSNLLKRRADDLRSRYDTVRGEVDLYACFAHRALQLIVEDGKVTLIVPGSLIRSQSGHALRERLFERHYVDIEVFDNRAKFFAIDSRTKFLVVRARTAARAALCISFPSIAPDYASVWAAKGISISLGALRAIRPDLTVPEVRNAAEWRLFRRLSDGAPRFLQAETPSFGMIRREVDMTNDRAAFSKSNAAGRVPVLEGRHIALFRHDAKRYVSGTGRRAVWQARSQNAHCSIEPQFWVDTRQLAEDVRRHVTRARIGFCDIVGQTNERTVQAALIPPHVVCGNKVPTIDLDPSGGEEVVFMLLGIMNSVVFDWLARRVVTTSLNHFIVESLPLPDAALRTIVGRRIAHLARSISLCGHHGGERLAIERYDAARVELEIAVAAAYGVTSCELDLIFDDFPLFDRSQPPLPGERRSTVTRDAVVAEYGRRHGLRDSRTRQHAERVGRARELGARPLVTTELAEAAEGKPAASAHL